MTGEYADDNKRMRAAIDHALQGNRTAADAELAHIAGQGPDMRFRLWQALAETAVHPLRHQPPGGPLYGLEAFTGHPYIDTNDAPPGFLLALRFVTAQTLRDSDQLSALFLAAHDTGQHQTMAEAQGLLLDAAVASARAQLAEQRPGGPAGGATGD